jgi:hypothetical protein
MIKGRADSASLTDKVGPTAQVRKPQAGTLILTRGDTLISTSGDTLISTSGERSARANVAWVIARIEKGKPSEENMR